MRLIKKLSYLCPRHLEKEKLPNKAPLTAKMQLIDIIRMATATLTANKLRSSLTMLGLIIGNASVIAMVGIGQGAQKLAINELQTLGPNTLFITPGQQGQNSLEPSRSLVYEDAQAIAEQVPTVQGVAPEISDQQVITYRNENTVDSVQGTTPEYLSVRDFQIAQGRFLQQVDLQNNRRVVVLGSDIVEELFGTQNPIGEKIRIRNVSFEVIGVMEEKGSFLGNNQDNVVYIPLTTMAHQIVGSRSAYGIDITLISVSAQDQGSISAARFQIENLLRLRNHPRGNQQQDYFSVQAQQDILDIVDTVTGGLTVMLTAIAGISLLVGGIGVMNIMLVSVAERTQEIGLRKAVGAREKDILTQFLVEATILAVFGGIFGTLIGGGIVILAGSLSPLPTEISIPAVIIAVSVSAGIGLSFGVIPARSAAKLDPIVALRST